MSENHNQGKTDDLEEENISINELYNILSKEFQSQSIQAISLDIYQKSAYTIGRLHSKNYEGIELEIKNKLIDIFSTLISLLLKHRIKKINDLLMGEYESDDENTKIDFSKITDEEKFIIDFQNEFNNTIDQVLRSIVNGRPKLLDIYSKKIKNKKIVIQFLDSIGEFIGVDMNKYGPFELDDVTVLPYENAKSLIEIGKAVEIRII